MLKTGILNPALNERLSRVRHTNTIVIADRGFPFWPTIETVDISLIDGVPTVLQVLIAIRENFVIGHAFMAKEFLAHNEETVREVRLCAGWHRCFLRAARSEIQTARAASHRSHPHG